MKLLLVFVGLLATVYGTIITPPVGYSSGLTHGLSSWDLGSRVVMPSYASGYSSGIGVYPSSRTILGVGVPSSYSLNHYRTVPSVYGLSNLGSSYGLGSTYGMGLGYGLGNRFII